ncbi:MAG: PaaI family thioesterase [Clostridia bacterium]|nr:PaaI family thioesterase [Clostridia bacterium]
MNFLDHILKNDRFAILNKVELVEVSAEYAIAKAPVTENALNADGVAQGGFIFTLADLCFTFLANYLHPRTVTQMATATYVAPAKGKWLWAKAVELSATKHNDVVQVTVTDEDGNTVGLFQFNGFIAKTE